MTFPWWTTGTLGWPRSQSTTDTGQGVVGSSKYRLLGAVELEHAGASAWGGARGACEESTRACEYRQRARLEERGWQIAQLQVRIATLEGSFSDVPSQEKLRG